LEFCNWKLRWAGFQIAKLPDYKITKFSERQCCSKKDLVIVKLGVARSEIRALSGAGMEDLVALETWPSDSEIVNLT
jgi:hypothetical protein